MQAVTTHHGPGSKPFSWSYSRLKNYETCPKRHWHIDVARDVKEDESEQLQWGNALHKAAAERLANGAPLPKGMGHLEEWCQRILTGEGKVYVEQKLAITADFAKTEWFAKDAWFRAIGDVIKVTGRVALIGDWKTGRIVEDNQQLALSAACLFAHYPDVSAVRSEFFWLKYSARTSAVFRREDMAQVWRSLWPRIEALKKAHETTTFPPKKGGLCRNWCPVTQCPHHGT